MKSTVELLDLKFRLAMKEGRVDPKKKHDILHLTREQKSNIIEYMRSIGKYVTEQELDVCFASFRRQYWNEHSLPPRAKERARMSIRCEDAPHTIHCQGCDRDEDTVCPYANSGPNDSSPRTSGSPAAPDSLGRGGAVNSPPFSGSGSACNHVLSVAWPVCEHHIVKTVLGDYCLKCKRLL